MSDWRRNLDERLAQLRGALGLSALALPALAPPLDLRLLGRMLLHAALIGLVCGLMAAGFFAGLEWVQALLLERIAGYEPLRAHGEAFATLFPRGEFRPWLLPLIPALGALGAGWISRWAPETRGGGGDAIIEAFHENAGVVRRRVAPLKTLASILTLGSGGAGGREGPTMQIGGALGSLVGRALRVSARERRILLVAGIAAGISGMFRTPLGAALLAVEVLWRDDFEADALIPAILSSVLSYSVVISIFGESTLFSRPPPTPFVTSHLPLYVLLAVGVSAVAGIFLESLKLVRRATARLPMPRWLTPAFGGLALGLFATGMILLLGPRLGLDGRGLGILGGGYGAAQVAIAGAAWLPDGWRGVEILLILCAAKIIASSLTIGTGGSAGDFAPSIVLGALFGGAFGRAASFVLADPRIQPGAFALVGMGAFYGSIANVPVASLILISEMAGSYDLLVPSMLAVGCSTLVLRKRSLYEAQRPSRRVSVERGPAPEPGTSRLVRDLDWETRQLMTVAPSLPVPELVRRAPGQPLFVVADREGRPKGLIRPEALGELAADPEALSWMVAADLMEPLVAARLDEPVSAVATRLVENGLGALPALDDRGRIVGAVDATAIARSLIGDKE